MKMAYKLFVIILLSMTLSACSTMSDWFEEEKTALSPADLVDFEAEFKPDKVWSVDVGEGAKTEYNDLRPWIQNEAIIAVDHQGEVDSYQTKNGKLNWQIELDVPVVAGPGGGDGLILIGTRQGEVIALDEVTGRFKWRQRLSSEILTPPKASNGVVVVRTGDGKMSGLSVENGAVLWDYRRSVPLLSLRGAGAEVLYDDIVIAGYASGKLVAYSITDGKVIWERSVAVSRGRTELDRLVDIDSEPVLKQGRVYVVAYHGNVTSIDIESGQIIWSREMSSKVGLDVAPDEAVYVTDEQSYVWALQDGSGNGLWRQTELLRRNLTAPVIVGDYIIVGDFEGYVHWLSREDGRFVARTRIARSPIRSKPIVKDDLVFIETIDGTLTAIRVP